jgi:glycosyltransferase involved in cell wall biosynthesis
VSDRPIRVLHAPAAVGGHAPGLAAAERELGLDSVVVTLHAPPFGYEVDRVLAPPGTSTARREWRRWREIARAREYDVVHFNFGSSLAPAYHGTDGRGGAAYGAYSRLLEQLDLRLLRGPSVFVTFQGDDVRPSGDGRDDAFKRRRATRFAERAAALYVLNPDLLEHVPGAEFLPYASVDLRAWTPAPSPRGDVLRVVHAPSDRRRKGTEAIVAAVAELRESRVAVELELVEGRPRTEARQAYERADVVVDQLLVGWYGGLAVEAMALAKPVVARLDPAALGRVPNDLRADLPIVHADRRSLEDALRDLAQRRPEDLIELGLRGRAFVERWHDPLAVARRTKAAYERAVGR